MTKQPVTYDGNNFSYELLAALMFEWLIIPTQKKWKMLVYAWG